MNTSKVASAGLVGGTLLFFLLFGLNVIMNHFIAYDITKFGGMRSMDDPVMMLFFLYPYVVAFAAACLFDFVQPLLQGTIVRKGTSFGLIMVVVLGLPGDFAMFTSLEWPVTFYIGNLIWAIAGFLLTGILFARIWDT